MQKNKNYIKVTQHKSIYIGKKREIKSTMCNRIKSAKQIRCAKTVYWDLINSNMNKRDVQTSALEISSGGGSGLNSLPVRIQTGVRTLISAALAFLTQLEFLHHLVEKDNSRQC